ncbi:MAG: sterol desaturase family protein [Aeoliella sp.]
MIASHKHVIAIGVLASLVVLESLIPFFADQLSTTRLRLRHDARNFVWGVVNAAVGALFASSVLVAALTTAEAYDFGLLRLVEFPIVAEWALAFLLFDLWMYFWHRINHVVPFLWRFHRMHHSDRQMDTSTGVRFHTGEIVLSSFARIAIVPVLGISVEQLIAYEAALLPVVFFHHSNLWIPRWLDYGLAYVVVSPAVHRVHHSQIRDETNSNYGSIFSWWDRLFRTLRMRADVENIKYGLEEFSGSASDTLTGMAATPLSNSGKNLAEVTQRSDRPRDP